MFNEKLYDLIVDILEREIKLTKPVAEFDYLVNQNNSYDDSTGCVPKTVYINNNSQDYAWFKNDKMQNVADLAESLPDRSNSKEAIVRIRDNASGNGGLNHSQTATLLTGEVQNLRFYWVANSNSDKIRIARHSDNDAAYEIEVYNVSIKKLNGLPGLTSGGPTFTSDTP